MRYLLFVVLLLVVKFSEAQVNILDQVGKRNFYSTTFNETESSIFIIRSNKEQVKKNHLSKSLYIAEKYDKQTQQLKSNSYLAGDTVLSDTLTVSFPILQFPDGHRIHYCYAKVRATAAPTTPVDSTIWYLCYKQLDTNLNLIVPEKKLGAYTSLSSLQPRILKRLNNRLFVSFQVYDTATPRASFPRYMYLDNLGNVVKEDTLMARPLRMVNSWGISAIHDYSPGKFLIAGDILTSRTTNHAEGFVVTDTSFNLIDSFEAVVSGRWYNKPPISGKFQFALPYNVLLPSGSVIGAGIFDGTYSGAPYPFAGFTRFNVSKRFNQDSIVLFGPQSPMDGTHNALGFILNNIVYNKEDNLVYMAAATHQHIFLKCTAPSNYIEVVAIDTNLNKKFQKFIYADTNNCALINGITNCVGRSGVLVGGYRYYTPNSADTAQQHNFFLYRIDSTGLSSNNINEAGIIVRDRFRIYPNPVQSNLFIDDFLNGICSVSVYDLMGRAALCTNVQMNPYSIDFSALAPGNYFLRLQLKDGNSYTQKIVKAE